MELENFEMVDVTDLCEPGVYRIDSIATGRSLFGEASELLGDLQDFARDLRAGICDNENLLKDFQTFGINNFRFIAIVVGPQFGDIEKRKSRLEEEKSKWPPELLY